MATPRHAAGKTAPAAIFVCIVCLLAVSEKAQAELLPFDQNYPIEYPLLMYWENTGELRVRARNTVGTTSPRVETITIDSDAGIFGGELTGGLSGTRKLSDHTIVRDAIVPLGFESFSLVGVAEPLLTEDFLLADLSVKGALTNGEEFGPADGDRPTMLTYYPGIRPGGLVNDQRLSIIYDANNGNVSLDVPPGQELTSISIVSDSSSPIFTRCAIRGSIDPCGDTSFFHATFRGTFRSMSFGSIMEPELLEEFLLRDLSVVGSIAAASGGGAFRDADLIYVPVPEPCSIALLTLGSLFLAPFCRFRTPESTRA